MWLAALHCAAPIKEGAEEACMTGLHGTPEYCAPEVRCSAELAACRVLPHLQVPPLLPLLPLGAEAVKVYTP